MCITMSTNSDMQEPKLLEQMEVSSCDVQAFLRKMNHHVPYIYDGRLWS